MELSFDLAVLAKVAFSFLLGGLIGLEREWAQKPAGLRTHMLVSGAATLFVILGDIMIRMFNTSDMLQAVRADPIRIMESIITGISFLGAGTIILRKQKAVVEGLTTAASILFASAIGIGVALGKMYLSAGLTLMVLAILVVLGYVEQWISDMQQRGRHKEDEHRTNT